MGLDVPLFCYTDPLPDIDRCHDVYPVEWNIVIDSQTNKHKLNLPQDMSGQVEPFARGVGVTVGASTRWGCARVSRCGFVAVAAGPVVILTNPVPSGQHTPGLL